MTGKKIIFTSDTEQILKKMGLQIKSARLRRNIKAEEVAEQAGISKGTLTAIEKGVSTVSIGAYAAALQVLGLEKDLGLVAVDDEGKKKYPMSAFFHRNRATGEK